MAEVNLRYKGIQLEEIRIRGSARGSTLKGMIDFSKQLSLKEKQILKAHHKSKASSCCINAQDKQRQQLPKHTDYYFEPCCPCRTLAGYKNSNPPPAFIPKGQEVRRKDGKVILPCPGCEEPRVPPLPNECFAFCKTHVGDFNSCRKHQTPKKSAKK